MGLFDSFGKIVVNVQKIIEAKTDKEAIFKVNTKFNPDTIRKMTVIVEDNEGKLHNFEINEVVEMNWDEVEEHIPSPFERMEETA